MFRRRFSSVSQGRNPQGVHAWLVGSGIASLTSAVHLMKDAQVPPSQIHILETHSYPGGGVDSTGDPGKGYVIHAGRQPNFNDPCMEELLSSVPSSTGTERTLLDEIKEFNELEAPQEDATTHVLVQGQYGPEELEMGKSSMTHKERMDLLMFMLEGEKALNSKSVKDCFGESFFQSKFWCIWAATFAFQPWHSAIEFRRYLRKYLHDTQSLNNMKMLGWTRFSQYESLIMPIAHFLEEQGVDFRFHCRVTDLKMSTPTTVTELTMMQNGTEKIVTIDPNDVVIVTLGSISSGSTLGSNSKAPAPMSMGSEDSFGVEWSIWSQLAMQSPNFGNPTRFSSRIPESSLETFTVTLRDPEFLDRLLKLTKERPGTGGLLILKDSNWAMSLSIPHQPMFSDQPPDVQVFWGYSLFPERIGNFVRKPMFSCTGQEIMSELLQHLRFPTDSILKNSVTVPCFMPHLTAQMLTRHHGDRPEVVPRTNNVAVIGQYVEIPEDTTFTIEYSVRGAQMAVQHMMGLVAEPKKRQKHYLAEFLEALV
ncbi:hypothetical protein ASPZODRAFT_74643 [Penicilliopsis zonata CBS 506.65]|uniref:Oleate hydratase n=1 Tax=Penicilliopsis zonata CBS 506.65 TaxID=1073090 RepID=A0A1L9S813_9EURO|nr:hypothetical protein ASPZODRAFT_74643 [Penicilliopsis zonata CBS 506.65]OJJ43291.1 hypothetical protein ASPZODRAFT_74643 [Penicilliopsis zonata CBS 506.65]